MDVSREEIMTEIKCINNKFHGFVNGREVVKSSSRYYVQRRLDELNSEVEIKQESSSTDFDINQRFGFVTDLVSMVANGATASAVITGEGGLGKTYTVIEALRANGLKDITEVEVGEVVPPKSTYRVVKGFSTAKGLYRILFENQNSIIVFDDCDSVLKNDDACNILKGALDSFDKRIITWNTSRDDDDIPRWFQFKGGVIFISNMPMAKIEQSIRSRAMCVDLEMTVDQKIQRMEVIMQSPDFLPEIAMGVKVNSLALINELRTRSKEVSLRTFIKTVRIANTRSSNWKSLAEYMLLQG